MMIISHNAAAFAAWRQVTRNGGKMSVHLERMSTGLRINRGADDAAGLAISEKMRSQIRGVQQAMRNAQDGISMIQTAEGALQESHAVLQRMRELLVQAANDTYTMEDRMKINDEIQNLKKNLDEIAQHTEFNTMKLLDGSSSLRISSSSNLVEFVAGENHSAMKAAASMITQSSGALRVDMEISGGTSQVQNSHIYNQINGTLSDSIQKSPESGKYSGLTAFKATGLKEESYVIESREIPFGGIYYVDRNGNETTDPNAILGISSMEVTATPNIVAFGDYEITPAKEVPFMAIFDDYHNTQNDLIRGVDPTGRDDIDVRMDVVASLGAVDAQTEVAWTDIGGAGGGSIVDANPAGHVFPEDVAYQTDAAFNTNLYTHFQVNALDPRDLLASNIQAVSSYVSATGSEVDLELTYKSEAGAQVNMALDYRASAASQVDMELTYRTAAVSRVGVEATYQAKASETISFDTTYVLPPTYNVTITGSDSGVLGTASIGGMNLVEARDALIAAFSDITFSIEEVDGRRRIRVTNDHASVQTITIDGPVSNELGLNVVNLAHGTSLSGTLQDYDTRTNVDVSGQTIEEIAATLNGSLGGKGLSFAVAGPANGTRLTIENTGSHNAQIVNDGAGDSAETELGLNGYNRAAGSGLWDGGQSVFHNHTFEIDISNQFLQSGAGGFLEIVQDAINAQAAADLSISGVTATTGGGTLRGFTLNNGSRYRLTFSDVAGGDWDLLNMSHSINRAGNRSSNTVYHNHTFSANVSNQSLSQIRVSLRNDLSTALTNDGISNPVTVDNVFQLENGSGNLDRILIQNTGAADTRYQLKINSHTGAIDNELNLVSTIERGANYSDGHLVHHNNALLINDIGDLDLDQIATALQGRLVSMLDQDELVNPGGTTFVRAVHPSLGNLNRLETRNTAGANTSYAITLTDAVGGMANQLNLHNTVTNRNTTRVSHGVYHEHIHRIGVGDRDLEEIRTVLQSNLQNLVNNDQIANTNTQNSFLQIEDPPGSGRHRIVVDNTGNGNTSYQIRFSDHAGGEVAQQLGINTAVNRANSHNGLLRDYGFDWGVVATNSTNIEQLMAELNSHELFSTAWVTQPNYTDQYYGRFSITNVGNPDAADEKRRVTLRSAVGTGANQLLGGEMTLRLNSTGQTQLWQARDRIQVHTQYNGITNTGSDVSGSRTDWWWEGVDGDRNPLVADPNLGFTSLKINDNTINASELAVGDAWSLFTIARGNANHDRLDFHLQDGASSSSYASQHADAGTSDHGGGSYRFNNGILDNRSMFIPQDVRMGVGVQESFDHRIQFGNTITSSTDAVVYKERYQVPEFDHYAHAYYGDDTTYFFENKGDWSDYIQNVEVWRQEDTNMSMLFKVLENGNLEVEGKGYHRDGSVADFNPVEIARPTGGPIEIGSVWFDDLVIGGPLTTGDKFVINIAARAGHVDSVDSHGDLVYTDANVAITGSPFRIMSSEMQYRFDENVVNGRELNLLGYFVHPIMGGLESGYYTGTINMGVSGAGFTAGTRVDEDQKALLEVNYFGRFDHLAGALINDFYFAQLEPTAPTNIVIDSIEYNQQSKWNGSVVFEVLEADESSVLLRGQAHLYDVDMQYRYEEDDYILLDKSNSQLTLFQKMGFEGLTFTEFCFYDLSKLSVEDVFTLTLSANAEFAGENFDELFLFSEQYPGSMYPMGWRFRDKLLDDSTTTLKTFQIGPWNDPMTGEQVEGWVHEGQITLGFKDFHGGTVEGVLGSKTTPRIIEDTVRFDSVYKQGFDAGTANRHTRLVDIAELYDHTGTFLLDEPQFIQILSDGKDHSIWLRPDDRLLDVMDRINHAMYEVFGQKDLVRQDQQYKFAYFTDQRMEQSPMARPEGTFMIQSALAGKQGEVILNGNPDLVRILGMQVIREASESSVTMTLSDAVRGTVLQKDIKASTNQAMMLGEDPRAQIKVSSKFGNPAVDYNEILKAFTHGIQQANSLFLRVIDQTRLLHIGANQKQDTLFQIDRMDSQALGLKGLTALTREKANEGIGKVDRATGQVSGQRSMLGALQNRLEHTIDNLGVTAENLTQSESRIRDADMAWEVMMLTKQQILLQTAQSMLSQANTLPNQILDLLRGI